MLTFKAGGIGCMCATFLLAVSGTNVMSNSASEEGLPFAGLPLWTTYGVRCSALAVRCCSQFTSEYKVDNVKQSAAQHLSTHQQHQRYARISLYAARVNWVSVCTCLVYWSGRERQNEFWITTDLALCLYDLYVIFILSFTKRFSFRQFNQK